MTVILVANRSSHLADFPACSQIECGKGFLLPNPAAAAQIKKLHGKGLENAKKVELLAVELLDNFAEFMLHEHALKFLAENVA